MVSVPEHDGCSYGRVQAPVPAEPVGEQVLAPEEAVPAFPAPASGSAGRSRPAVGYNGYT